MKSRRVPIPSTVVIAEVVKETIKDIKQFQVLSVLRSPKIKREPPVGINKSTKPIPTT